MFWKRGKEKRKGANSVEGKKRQGTLNVPSCEGRKREKKRGRAVSRIVPNTSRGREKRGRRLGSEREERGILFIYSI